MLASFISCTMPTDDDIERQAPNEENQSPSDNSTSSNEVSTSPSINTPIESDKVTESDKTTETDKNTESNESTNTTDIKKDYITIAGNKPYKIVYQSQYSAQAETLLKFLKIFDKDTNFSISTDIVSDSGSPEILIGLTNRAASTNAKNATNTYLDYSITVTDNKIAIFANTAERLNEAIEYFLAQLKFDNNGFLAYPTSDPYVNSYKNYTYPSLTINGDDIKKFSIVIPQNATQKEKDASKNLSEWIALNTGYLPKIVTDNATQTNNEIIIGNANRTECSIYSANVAEQRFHSAIIKNKKLLLYAGNSGTYDSAIKAFTDNAQLTKGSVKNLNVIEETTAYDGKKAIFIGNSFIYWGGCVTFLTNDDSNEIIRSAGGDKGYFNEICKANGINMDVYNYTYGGQNLDWIYNNKLKNLSSTFLNDIDYVFISEAGQNNSNFKTTVNKVANLFKNAEEIVYLAHEYTFSQNATYIINSLDDLSNEGYKIVAWGALVNDVYNKKVAVPNATLQYNKNTFIKNSSSSEKMNSNAAVISRDGYGDSFHQNPLSGYITAQMCFSAITDASAVGQKYDFCWDKTIAPQYDLENFLTYQYGKGQTSNFIEVFNSKSDMLGLQTLMDQYMKKYN